MDLKQLQTQWDEWGRRDPLWAILSDHGERGLEDFFARGRSEIAQRLAGLHAKGVDPPRSRALDFGSGMGRLTQALCDHFAECDGVEIAPSMIELARRHNRHGDRCRYHLNSGDDLSRFPDRAFDFIYTALVLQHMRPRYGVRYLREFFRLLAPGGVAMFQIPGEAIRSADFTAPLRAASPPLPAGACAEIRMIDLPASRPAGLQFKLHLTVRNAGEGAWPAARTVDGANQLVVVNRWLDPSGDVVEAEDGRALLPHDLEAGAAAGTSLIVTAPNRPGRYVLEVDVLEEGRGRFGERGGHVAAAPLDILEAPPESTTPAIQMFGVGRHAVTKLVEEAGLCLVDASENRSAGPHWTSCTYALQRP